MINTPAKDQELSDDKKEKMKKYAENMKADLASYELYQQIYAMIPEEFLIEKDVNHEPLPGLKTKYTKWHLNKETNKDIIDTLQKFAVEKKLR